MKDRAGGISGRGLRAKPITALVLGMLAGWLLLPVSVLAQGAGQPVVLKLKWTHQFQFAGVYAALEQGYYAEAGLDVTLLEGGPEQDPVAAVVDGRAEFGIGNSSLIIDRAAGRPVMVVAPIFQHSPFVILARVEPGLESVRDLAGRVLGLEEHAAECLAYLQRSGVPLDRIEMVPHPGDTLALADGSMDAISAYTTTEPYDLIHARVPYQVWSPRDVGIDFYGDTLFVSAPFAEANPETVRAFRDATIRGWRYALAHPGRIIDLILRDYAPGYDRLKLGFEAEDIKRLMLPHIVDIGYNSPARWRQIADLFAESGMMPANYPLDGFVFEDDLAPDRDWLYLTLAAALALMLLASLVAHRFYRFSRALRRELQARRALEAELSAQARTDDLTGLPNRRGFFERAEALLVAMQRDGQPLALVALDIDRFKSINDTWGHAAGDAALQSLAQACRDTVPAEALLARIGGEEFAVVLPGWDALRAADLVQALRTAIAAAAVRPGAVLPEDSTPSDGDLAEVPLTASYGIAIARPGGGPSSLDTLMSQADAAMYAAKRDGGDRFRVAEQAPSGRPDTVERRRGGERRHLAGMRSA